MMLVAACYLLAGLLFACVVALSQLRRDYREIVSEEEWLLVVVAWPAFACMWAAMAWTEFRGRLR